MPVHLMLRVSTPFHTHLSQVVPRPHHPAMSLLRERREREPASVQFPGPETAELVLVREGTVAKTKVAVVFGE